MGLRTPLPQRTNSTISPASLAAYLQSPPATLRDRQGRPITRLTNPPGQYNCTDACGENAYPGIKTIARDCCMSTTNVKRVIKDLRERRWIVVRSGRAGVRPSTTWRWVARGRRRSHARRR
jgi:DNA-binding MarR family transcriptional regulator